MNCYEVLVEGGTVFRVDAYSLPKAILRIQAFITMNFSSNPEIISIRLLDKSESPFNR